jgi:hypothetical protein
MGGNAMRERQEVEELSATVSLGLLAEDMILVIGRASRHEELRERDRRVLEAARNLFRLLGSDNITLRTPGADQMLSDTGYLDALRAMESRAGDGDAQEVAAGLVELIELVLRGDATDEHTEPLLRLRGIFVEVGKATLMRSNELGRTQQESRAWRPTPTTSLF